MFEGSLPFSKILISLAIRIRLASALCSDCIASYSFAVNGLRAARNLGCNGISLNVSSTMPCVGSGAKPGAPGVFGGERVDITSKENLNADVDYLRSLKEDTAWNIHAEDLTTYTMLTDEEQFNVWKNYETGELPEYPLVWNFGEPNGGMVENCAQIWIKKNAEGEWTGTFNDQTCTKPVPVACEGVGEVVLTLRGI